MDSLSGDMTEVGSIIRKKRAFRPHASQTQTPIPKPALEATVSPNSTPSGGRNTSNKLAIFLDFQSAKDNGLKPTTKVICCSILAIWRFSFAWNCKHVNGATASKTSKV